MTGIRGAFAIVAAIWLSFPAGAAEPEIRTLNNGNLVLQDVPPIPEDIVAQLNRYQNVRFASFREWTEDGKGIYVSTRFADTSQLHQIDFPGGARKQITFDREPIGRVVRQPAGANLAFTRDAGGNEFAQVFLLNPADGSTAMLTDGESRNQQVVWDRDGRRMAFQSTRRNGASNDIWIMDPTEKEAAQLVLEAPDGSWWSAVEFSASGSKVLISNSISITDSNVYLLDLDSGSYEKLTSNGANRAAGFDRKDTGFWLTTDRGGEFRQLAWQPLEAGADVEIVTEDLHWDINSVTISNDRRRLAFVSNENGLSKLYLMDAESRKYRAVDSIPTGAAFGLSFSPDDRRLAMTLNTPQTPSDTFVLELGNDPLVYGELQRWSYSEVGGLDSASFIVPTLEKYPTFDSVNGAPRQIPAWVYRPPGRGPFPVVVSIHGGPESQARPFFSSTYQMWLQTLGVAVVVPNVRGSAGFGKSYLGLDNGFNREDSVRDIGALLDWIGTQPDLDESRIAVTGGSYGGYMVLASAVHYSDRLKAAIDRVGISNFVTFLENTQEYRRDYRRQEYGDERDPEMRAHLEKISPLNSVSKIEVPLLVVQGQNDPRVPVTEAEQLVTALRKQGQPVWYMNALNEGHGYSKKENRDVYQQAVIMFLRQHLTGPVAATPGVL